MGEWAPPFFYSASPTPLGVYGVSVPAAGAGIMGNPANTGHASWSIVNANHSHLYLIGQACFSAMGRGIPFYICVSWSHVAAQARTAC